MKHYDKEKEIWIVVLRCGSKITTDSNAARLRPSRVYYTSVLDNLKKISYNILIEEQCITL